ncbi:hypothetical protein [Streptomyces sp. NPDC055299]
MRPLHDLVQIFAADRLRQEENAATREQAFQRLLMYYTRAAKAALSAINGEAESSAVSRLPDRDELDAPRAVQRSPAG